MIIKTKRLCIYPASNEQMERLIENESIPELKEAYLQMLSGCLEHPEKREWYAIWNIEMNNTVVGNLSFKGLSADGTLEIGYGMHEEYEGRGIMTEAVSAVVCWASAQKGVLRIEAETEDGNISSKRVLEKTSFVLSGVTGNEGPRYVWKGKK